MLVQSKMMSKDEYIVQLEAQLQSFRENTRKGSSSRVLLVCNCTVRRHEVNGGGAIRNATTRKKK